MPEQVNSLTVVETVYHRQIGEDATMVDCRFVRSLSTEEQPYLRNCKAREDWEAVDHGWLDSPGMVFFKNMEGCFPNRLPTQEEREAVANKILEIKYKDAPNDQAWLIHPTESFRCTPASTTNLVVRSRSGVARFSVCAYPE